LLLVRYYSPILRNFPGHLGNYLMTAGNCSPYNAGIAQSMKHKQPEAKDGYK
jgi:hypothetical protein